MSVEIIKIGEKTYKKTDFNNQWSLSQQKVAMTMFGSMFSELAAVENVEDDFKEVLNLMFRADMIEKVLALIYLEENEEYFHIGTYNQRLEIFQNVNYTEEIKAVVKDFFDTKGNLVVKDTLDYIKLISPQMKELVHT